MTEIGFKYARATLLSLAAIAAGCSTAETKHDLTLCTEPRPEVCTMDYQPVCGQRQLSGVERWKTYSNACTACADAAVVGYKEGACKPDQE